MLALTKSGYRKDVLGRDGPGGKYRGSRGRGVEKDHVLLLRMCLERLSMA